MTTKQLEEEALTLKSIDRIHLVEKLLISLNRPDPKMEKEWVLESEARYKAYKHGEIEPVSLQQIRDTHECISNNTPQQAVPEVTPITQPFCARVSRASRICRGVNCFLRAFQA